MLDGMKRDDGDHISADELEQLRLEALIEGDRRQRDAYADEAEARGLVYYPDAGLYADESGSAVNEYGERV